jgi:aspartate aminotransferase-like enzyme
LSVSDELLMIPGPTILPPEVREALALPSMYHRGGEFAAVLEECTRGLQGLFGTKKPVVILSSSGTGAVEACVVNTLSPGDRVLAIAGGKFGERIGEIAGAFGAEVDFMQVEHGRAANPAEVGERLAQGNYRALLFVLNETSTGVKQDGHALAKVAREHGAMTVVDCVSALAGMPVEFDKAGYAAAGAGSQKALMLPPGLSFAVLSEEGQQAAQTAKMPKCYFDLPKAIKSLAKGQTPYTPAVNLIVALQASLRLIAAEGIEAFQARHRLRNPRLRPAPLQGGSAGAASRDGARDQARWPPRVAGTLPPAEPPLALPLQHLHPYVPADHRWRL